MRSNRLSQASESITLLFEPLNFNELIYLNKKHKCTKIYKHTSRAGLVGYFNVKVHSEKKKYLYVNFLIQIIKFIREVLC